MLESFRRHSSAAVKEAQEKKKRMEEMDRKRKEKAELERKREEEELKKRWLHQFCFFSGLQSGLIALEQEAFDLG